MCFPWGTNWGFISQKTAFFIVTALKTSILNRMLVASSVMYNKHMQTCAYESTHIKYCATNKTKQTQWPLVRKRTTPTERPPLVGEI
jgi:hypothetical protein